MSRRPSPLAQRAVRLRFIEDHAVRLRDAIRVIRGDLRPTSVLNPLQEERQRWGS